MIVFTGNNHDGPNKINYAEGVFVGYRWFDARKIAPLFPFGHGLSYTRFRVDAPTLSSRQMRAPDTLDVHVRVTNTGDTAGAEVVQLYLAPPKTDVPRPARELKDFAKVLLQPGESKIVTMHINSRDLSYWDVTGQGWKAVPGTYQVEIGTSSRDIKNRAGFDYQP